MNVVSTAVKTKSRLRESVSNEHATKEPILNFYLKVPSIELALDDLEDYALSRIKILRTIEQKRNMKMDQKTLHGHIERKLQEEDLRKNVKRDVASHFILRLTYCRTEELRTWFCRQECELFRYRLKVALEYSPENARKMVEEHVDVKPLSESKKLQLRESLLKFHTSPTDFNRERYYAVSFDLVLKLVAERKCLLQKGKVYVPESKVIEILISKFRRNLSEELTRMNNFNKQRMAVGAMDDNHPETSRIYRIVNNLDKILTEREVPYEQDKMTLSNGEKIVTAGSVSKLVDHMPLCMRVLHRGMVTDKKLKYNGRLQYSLFLKGAGMTMEDSLVFFQRNFSSVSPEEFVKRYAYSIRHVYGKEGKRESKSPYNCSKIIVGMAAPSGVGQHHGCPYKHYDDEHLMKLMQNMNIGGANGGVERKEILRLKQQNQYQLACLKHFEIQHPGAVRPDSSISLDDVGNHPNAWFRASLDYKYSNSNCSGGGEEREVFRFRNSNKSEISIGKGQRQYKSPTESQPME